MIAYADVWRARYRGGGVRPEVVVRGEKNGRISNKVTKASPYLIHPAIDFFFVSGGALLLLVFWMGNHMADAFMPKTQATLLVLGSIFLTATHFGAPVIAARRQTFMQRLLVGPFAMALGGILLGILLCTPELLGYATQGYLLAVALHYCAQNNAIVQMYFKRADFKGDFCKLVLPFAMYLWTLFAFTVQLANGHGVSEFLGVSLPQWPILPQMYLIWIVMATFSVVAAAAGALLYTSICNRQVPPMPVLVLLATQTLLLIPMGEFSKMLWLFFPAFLHATQSIVLNCADGASAWTTGSSGVGVSGAGASGMAFNWTKAARSFMFGLAVAFGVPVVLTYFGVNEQTAFVAVVVVFSAHHFLLEALEWNSKQRPTRA